MKKTAFTIVIIFFIAFANAQPNQGNLIFTNALSINDASRTNQFQTRKNINQLNAPIALINQQQRISSTNRNVSNTNNRINIAQTATVKAHRRSTKRENNTDKQNQMKNISPVFVLINYTNTQALIINDNIEQNASNAIKQNNQSKNTLLPIVLPDKETKPIKTAKVKAATTSKSKRHSSSSKKYHKKNSQKKLKRLLRGKGIKNVKPNYELCFKF